MKAVANTGVKQFIFFSSSSHYLFIFFVFKHIKKYCLTELDHILGRIIREIKAKQLQLARQSQWCVQSELGIIKDYQKTVGNI